jgi:hypothetical protein
MATVDPLVVGTPVAQDPPPDGYLYGALVKANTRIEPLQLEWTEEAVEGNRTANVSFDDEILRTFVGCLTFLVSCFGGETNINILPWVGYHTFQDDSTEVLTGSPKWVLSVLYEHYGDAQKGHWGVLVMNVTNRDVIVYDTEPLPKKGTRFVPNIAYVVNRALPGATLSFKRTSERNAIAIDPTRVNVSFEELDKTTRRYLDCGPCALRKLVREVSLLLPKSTRSRRLKMLKDGVCPNDPVRDGVLTFFCKMLEACSRFMEPQAGFIKDEKWTSKMRLAFSFYQRGRSSDKKICVLCSSSPYSDPQKGPVVAFTCCQTRLHCTCWNSHLKHVIADSSINAVACVGCKNDISEFFYLDEKQESCSGRDVIGTTYLHVKDPKRQQAKPVESERPQKLPKRQEADPVESEPPRKRPRRQQADPVESEPPRKRSNPHPVVKDPQRRIKDVKDPKRQQTDPVESERPRKRSNPHPVVKDPLRPPLEDTGVLLAQINQQKLLNRFNKLRKESEATENPSPVHDGAVEHEESNEAAIEYPSPVHDGAVEHEESNEAAIEDGTEATSTMDGTEDGTEAGATKALLALGAVEHEESNEAAIENPPPVHDGAVEHEESNEAAIENPPPVHDGAVEHEESNEAAIENPSPVHDGAVEHEESNEAAIENPSAVHDDASSTMDGTEATSTMDGTEAGATKALLTLGAVEHESNEVAIENPVHDSAVEHESNEVAIENPVHDSAATLTVDDQDVSDASPETGASTAAPVQDEIPRRLDEWVPVLYKNNRQFDQDRDSAKASVFVIRYGVVYFACSSAASARSLQHSLSRLFVKPEVTTPAPYRCMVCTCTHTFQTALDAALHCEWKCTFRPGGDVNERKSYRYYPAHFVQDIAVACLEKTPKFPSGPLDLIDVGAIPFRFGEKNVRHFQDIQVESQQERSFIEPAKCSDRTFSSYATRKWNWLVRQEAKESCAGMSQRGCPPFLWMLSFIKHPKSWSEVAKNIIFKSPPPARRRRARVIISGTNPTNA